MKLNLEPSDFEALSARWIDRITALDAELYRVDHSTGQEMLGRSKGVFSGICIPYMRPEESAVIGYRIRRDEPDHERSSTGQLKEKAKYLTAPGQQNLIYWPRCAKEHLQDASLPIILTEGEFKTLALWRLAYHGDRKAPLFLPIGIGGVWNWRGTVGKDVDAKGKRVDVKGPIPDLDRIFWKGRKIAIAFDADADTKDTVQHARNSLVKELQGRGALVGVLQWDTNVYKNAKGIDDLLAAAGPDVVIKHWEAVTYKARTSTDDSAFRLTKNCVLYVGNDNSRPVKVCGRLEVVADTRSTDSVNWGRLIRWEDPDGRKHEWAMPLSLLHSDGSEIRQKLAYEGLPIVPGPRNYALLTQYLAEAPTDSRVTCVDRIGWHGDTFVLPKEVYGIRKAEVILQSTNVIDLIDSRGTLKAWQKTVGEKCRGNSRLILALCCGVAGPLLRLIGEESGGVHFVGKSSSGKSTALTVGSSVIGGSGDAKLSFVQSWRSTMNGLESVAAQHNDLTLFLDELAQIDARDAAETAYMLGNGSGKNRMNRSISSRPKLTWNLLFVSAGEITLADHALTAGKQTKAGADIRLLNIPAEAGGEHPGMFEDIHGAESPALFSRILKEACQANYGTVMPAFLQYVTSHKDDIEKKAREIKAEFVNDHARGSGEVSRAAERFGVIAAAGEIATAAGIFPFEPGQAVWAASKCFQAWLSLRGSTAAGDDEQAVRKVRMFIEQYGSSRFQQKENEKIIDRAGFRRTVEGEEQFLILPEVFRSQVVNGYQLEAVAKVLSDRKYLVHDKDRFTIKPHITAIRNTARVYCVKGSILDD